jgi:hypothetical protein
MHGMGPRTVPIRLCLRRALGFNGATTSDR